MPPSLTHEAKRYLNSMGARPRKKWGQNFMVSESALETIADALGAGKEDTVIEIGPGLGFLTTFLLERAKKVIAIEKDPWMARHLEARYKGENLEIINQDVLKIDFKNDLKLTGSVKVAGNIPYNITSPLLERLIEQRGSVSRAVLTVQWEVAKRLTAQAGAKDWGALSVFVQVYSKPRLLKKLNANFFYPSPKVDSAIVLFDFSVKPLIPIGSEEIFFGLVRRAFQKRRKTLLNAISEDRGLYLKATCTKILNDCQIDPGRRPETLTLGEWARLSAAFEAEKE